MEFTTIPLSSYAIAALVIAVIALAFWIVRLERKLGKLLHGKGSENLGESMEAIRSELSGLTTFRKGMEEYLVEVEKRLRKSIQGVGTVRFNPFKGTGEGGNQSFATALVNEHGDGVILSSLYSRDRVSIFSKPLKKKLSEFELSEEEKEAIDLATEK